MNLTIQTRTLLIDIEYQVSDSVLQWANSLLNNHPSSLAIVGTHGYLDPSSGYDSWATNFKNTVLDTHPNVFLTINGHFHPAGLYASRTRVGNRDELFFNRQDQDGYEGAATIRLLKFDTTTNTIAVTTYNTLQNSYLTDSDNQFTLTPSVTIPESASWMILSLLITATMLVVLAFGRKHC